MKNALLLLVLLMFATPFSLQSQEKNSDDSPWTESNFAGLKMRSVGPAFVSGRIADIAIHPDNNNIWYVAVGSGGVWKTKNSGVTWKPIFDSQPTYSTGCITLDPSNPHTIWVGTGENVGGRHVAFGDGIYRSLDDGKTWKNMGLKESEHISKIIIHPDNSNVLWVAVQGPLWNKGGERGLYKSTDGGETWNKTLGDDEWTGVTDVVMDPRDPNLLYAATWQRHRTVAALMGGGPESGIHKSTDGGETWTKLTTGLPGGDKGKIGLAISPQQPDVVYAAIELIRTKGGVYRSTNRGASWTKMSDAVSGATGPHYYQELYACPHEFDRLYLMDVRIQVSDDGGKNFRRLSERNKHSDNHAIAFRADEPDYLLVGTDAGIYESYDLAQTWRFIDNLPLTQYYKVAVDDQEPFYHIFGGTQDNGSHGGPSRTDDRNGITNADWYKTLGADGHQSAVEPGNPNIGYAETQQGGLHRIDRITGEQIYIKPTQGPNDPQERWNWDAPIVVSTNTPSTIYFASQRVWKSTDRGDSWTAISEDLTRNQERITLPIMGKQQSWDAAWDIGAMSEYNTITSLGISMIDENTIFAGTDDGIIQVTEDGGSNWTRIEVGSIEGIPSTAFVNDIKADLHDANTVYVCLDNHKYGDFTPYIIKSTDKGRSWTSIASNLPDRTLVWRLVQDHEDPDLLFSATEWGIYFSVSGGDHWIKLKGGVPTISFRDLAIQKRENDLVGASFGRSFYVLDDYSALRHVNDEVLAAEGTLFPVKDAWWYNQKSRVSNIGEIYAADNPDFGAVFTYYLSEKYTTMQGERKKMEKEMKKEGKDIPFPGWEALDAEVNEEPTKIWLVVQDEDGNVIRRVEGKTSKGMNRVAWDLRHSSKRNVSLESRGSGGWWNRGFMATPGTYAVTLVKEKDGLLTELSEPQQFEVIPLREGALPSKSYAEIDAYRSEMETVSSMIAAAETTFEEAEDKVSAMRRALVNTAGAGPDLAKELFDLEQELKELYVAMDGNQSKQEIGERTAPTVGYWLSVAYRGLSTTYGPTRMHQESLDIAKEQFGIIKGQLMEIIEERIPAAEQALKDAGGPWIEGQPLPKGN